MMNCGMTIDKYINIVHDSAFIAVYRYCDMAGENARSGLRLSFFKFRDFHEGMGGD